MPELRHPVVTRRASNPCDCALVPAIKRNKCPNLFLFPRLVWRDVNSGDLAMSIALTRSGTVTGAVLARATDFRLR